MSKKLSIPKGKYIKSIEVNDDGLNVSFAKKKKIALLFIAVNERYWPYVKTVIEDCEKLFMPHHKVDFFVWTDIPREDSPELQARLNGLLPDQEFQTAAQSGARPPDQWWGRETIRGTIDFLRNHKKIKLQETEGADWPAPTLMRFHLFLNEEEALKDYDYIFYLDADMRVVDKISDEIMGDGLTAAPHPGYAIDKRFIPPYEPNEESEAYIARLGRVVDDGGKPRFMPFYAAGGFQGGKSGHFIKAMKKMKSAIDKDFNRNYIAIWNDESHWNKYLWEYQKAGGKITFLDPSYVYPDSLIKEYYVPLWGRDYPPKIITLTKPFSLSKQAGAELAQMIGGGGAQPTAPQQAEYQCPKCNDKFQTPGYRVKRIVQCPGSGKAHQIDMEKI